MQHQIMNFIISAMFTDMREQNRTRANALRNHANVNSSHLWI